MKKIFLTLAVSLLASSAFADSAAIENLMGLGMSAPLATLVDNQYAAATTQSELPATTNTYDLGSASKTWRNVYVGTAAIFSSGANVQLTAYAPVLISTPVAGTNIFQPGLNVVPTVAANAAAFIGPATPVPGQQFTIINSGANAVRAKAAGGATLNGATAGGYISIASLATVECKTQSTGNQVCEQPVIPTPAGP